MVDFDPPPQPSPAGEGAKRLCNSLYLLYKKLCRYLHPSTEHLQFFLSVFTDLSLNGYIAITMPSLL
jgi:hypothetical protein